ncbi:integration host factor subunit beta [Parasaccharibacter sp. TMW2.1882]|uniref:Integration host factor subunit beta n=2 Tax=Acetobacteraceae TaxID=433 RepID=A0ABX4ZM62_9PROT|nr:MULTISPECIES: HU family DNA-binding protein [Acetobacteraceae]MUG79617.1 integration host factor subunit beta [Bombella sp. ESL0380]MUH02918.1 integration host factor subunit beta [Bombella sp. ESL0387]MBE1723479.1 integration host factor subunit beta [Bombella apis]MBR9730258.1 integration host factor subunit beta [Bombella apis]MCK8636908.1 integration host factor subunit beta [Parasaccharibacter sp. TMW2.1885]
MTRSEFVALLTSRLEGVSRDKVDQAVDGIFSRIASGLAAGNRAELRGIGSFGTRQHTAHQGRNPRTGQSVAVRAKRVPFFRAGKDLRERVNQPKK